MYKKTTVNASVKDNIFGMELVDSRSGGSKWDIWDSSFVSTSPLSTNNDSWFDPYSDEEEETQGCSTTITSSECFLGFDFQETDNNHCVTSSSEVVQERHVEQTILNSFYCLSSNYGDFREGVCEISTQSDRNTNIDCDKFDETPFWFGDEDANHIKRVLMQYEKSLGLDKERRHCKRAPIPFIGRVQRKKLKHFYPFTTLDIIDTYVRDVVPLGVPMPFRRTEYMLASWDIQSGLPNTLRVVSYSERLLRDYESRTCDTKSSWLYCRPVFGSDEYMYSTDVEGQEVGYSNAPFSYHQFLPKRNKTLEDDNVIESYSCSSMYSSDEIYHCKDDHIIVSNDNKTSNPLHSRLSH